MQKSVVELILRKLQIVKQSAAFSKLILNKVKSCWIKKMKIMSKPSVTSLTIISAVISMSDVYCVSGLAHKICIRIIFVCFS